MARNRSEVLGGEPWSTTREVSFHKGYNDTLPPDHLPPGFLADALNCVIRTDEIKKRTGYTLIANDPGTLTKCQGLKGIRFASGTKEMLAVFNGSIYKWTGSGNWTVITGGTSVLSTTAQVHIEIANNNAYFFDGTSTVPKYDGTSITTVAAIPKGTIARWYHNILCVVGMSGTPNSVQLSDLGNPENFSSGITTTIAINPNDGDYITGLNEMKDELLVFKSKRTFSLSGFGTTSLTVSNLQDRIPFGALSNRAVVSTGNEILYLSFTGDIPHIRRITRTLYGVLVDGGLVSENIEGTLNGLNKGQLTNAAGVYDGRRAWFAVPNGSSTTNNLILVYDTVYKAWTRYTGINASVFESFVISTTPTIYFGEATGASKVYNFDTSTSDNGTAINFSVTSRRYGSEMPERKKKFKWFKVTAKEVGNYNVTIDYSKDGFDFANLGTLNLGGTGTVFDTIVLDTSRLGSTDVKRKSFSFPDDRATYTQLKLYDTSATSAVTIRDWEITYRPLRIRGI